MCRDETLYCLCMVTVVLGYALVFCGGFSWLLTRYLSRQNVEFQVRVSNVHEHAMSILAQSMKDTSTAVGSAVGSAVQASLAPPPAPPRDELSARQIARELYEQGVVPTYNDPVDDSDPSDFFYPANMRPDAAFANGDDPAPFGVPGVPFAPPTPGGN